MLTKTLDGKIKKKTVETIQANVSNIQRPNIFDSKMINL